MKYIPIIDPIEEIIKDNRNINHKLPNVYNYNISEKVNNFQNSSYIDSFFTFLGSKLTESGKCPCFPTFYGSINGIKQNYLYDLSDDYSQVKYHNNFQRNLNRNYELVIKQNTQKNSDVGSFDCSDSDSIDLQLEIMDDVEFQNIKDIIDDEYNKYNGFGSIRGYYSFVHRPLCGKIKHKINILCFKYKCALNKLNKHNHIFLQWLYKPNGAIFKKIAFKTYVGRLPPPSHSTIPHLSS